jgi:hypothetical protein
VFKALSNSSLNSLLIDLLVEGVIVPTFKDGDRAVVEEETLVGVIVEARFSELLRTAGVGEVAVMCWGEVVGLGLELLPLGLLFEGDSRL